jgi:predicted DCC family thiol-disulfide oxidoreductase YuxK
MKRYPLPFFRAWTPKPAPDWPDHLILFDGMCVLCSSWVRKVIARDDAGLFRFVTVQSPSGRRLAESLGIDPVFAETNAVIIDGMAFFKSDAVIEIARRLRGLRWAGIFRIVPKGLRDRLYDVIARNRYAWFGRDEACLRPMPDIAARIWGGTHGATPP